MQRAQPKKHVHGHQNPLVQILRYHKQCDNKTRQYQRKTRNMSTSVTWSSNDEDDHDNLDEENLFQDFAQ